MPEPKPDCYQCVHQGEVPGDAHSCCQHPNAGGDDPLGRVMATFASVGRVAPVMDAEGAEKLTIKGHPHGIRMGWFNWPYNFDPTWLEECSGFEAKKAKAV